MTRSRLWRSLSLWPGPVGRRSKALFAEARRPNHARRAPPPCSSRLAPCRPQVGPLLDMLTSVDESPGTRLKVFAAPIVMSS